MLTLTSTSGSFMNSPIFWVIYIIFFAGLFYFMSYRPQKKERDRKATLVSSMSVDDMVIVEFGNNKNCRIPMKKEAIVEIEKPEAE